MKKLEKIYEWLSMILLLFVSGCLFTILLFTNDNSWYFKSVIFYLMLNTILLSVLIFKSIKS